MKQTNSKVYNRKFYERVYKDQKKFDNLDFVGIHDYYREISELEVISSKDKIVDFGCGNGNLSFYLTLMHSPSIVGIDYSKDAIHIAAERQQVLTKKGINVSRIKFLNSNNNNLPKLKSINKIFACDVFEHMYNKEIGTVLKVFKLWKGSKKVKIIVHTDNNYYLNFIRPILDLIAILTKNSTFKQIQNRNKEEKLVHVNLTNPHRLRVLMKKYGFRQIKVTYPEVTYKKISNQLGTLSKFNFIRYPIYIVLNCIKFLSPSFYAVYEY